MSRLKEKMILLEEELIELEEVLPETFSEYNNNKLIRLSCERVFEKVIEAAISVIFLVLKEKKVNLVSDDDDALSILLKKDIISNSVYKKIRQAKGMRNIIVHQYEVIDDHLVFETLRDYVITDLKLFLEEIKKSV